MRPPPSPPPPLPRNRAIADRSSSSPSTTSLGNVLGGTIWHSFFGGPLAYRTLGRKPFSQLQEVIFPRLFAFQTGTALALASLYGRSAINKVQWSRFYTSSDRNVWCLAVMAASGVANWFVVGPWTTSASCFRALFVLGLCALR